MQTVTRKRTAPQLFKEVYSGHKNFVTPHRLQCRRYGPLAIEITFGNSLLDSSKLIYGVTVVEELPDRVIPVDDLCACFGSREDAFEYVDLIKEFIKDEILHN